MKLPKLTPEGITISIKIESQSSDKWTFDALSQKTIDIDERIAEDLLFTYGIKFDVDVYSYLYCKRVHNIMVDIDVSGKEDINTAMDNIDDIVTAVYYYLKNIRIPGTNGTRIPLKIVQVSIVVDMK